MSSNPQKTTRLPRSFHYTFIPERKYINSMLLFASKGRAGDVREIGAATGIPTGESSGKVSAILDYCRGMGLVEKKSGKELRLTPFGRIVLKEDPFLKEEVTQWLSHLNLCRPDFGAETWYRVFLLGFAQLGYRFTRIQLENYLKSSFGRSDGNIVGPLVNMYEDSAAFSACGAISGSDSGLHRNCPPVNEEYAWAYAAWTVANLDTHFPKASEVTVTELDRVSGWKTICGWSIDEFHQVLRLLELKGVLSVDRHMNPWTLKRSEKCDGLWARIYSDLL